MKVDTTSTLFSEEQITEIERMICENHGKCEKCAANLKIYKYGVSKTMGRVLSKMCKATKTKSQAIDIRDLNLTYAENSQLTKMRFHALIAKVRENGHHKARHWVVTGKGWDFRAGVPIQQFTYVFRNTVIGHSDETTTIGRLLDDPHYEQEAVSQPEAKVYDKAREGVQGKEVMGRYKGYPTQRLKNNVDYKLSIERLQFGKPLTVIVHQPNGDQHSRQYKDIAAFHNLWELTDEA